METNWRALHQAALREQDPAKLHAACERARAAINTRLLKQVKESAIVPAAEREELEQALREITLHKSKKSPRGCSGINNRERVCGQIDAERIVETGLLARLLDGDDFTRGRGGC